MKPVAIIVALLTISVAGPVRRVHVQEPSIQVFSSNGVKAVVEALRPDIERTIGRALSIEFSTASSLAREIENGRSFDVAILTPALIERLIERNRVAADSRVDLARSGVGVGARPRSGTWEVGTPEAFRATLLAAESVAFTADGQSRTTIDRAFEELGISEIMRAKTVLLGPGEAPGAVAAGDAELALTLVSEIVTVPGLELVGPLPAPLQNYIEFAAGRAAAAEDIPGADALLEYLAGPEFGAELGANGMEAIGR